jgi:hypothetical protein
MLKRLLNRLRRDRGQHLATVRIDFFPQDQVTPRIHWHNTHDPEGETVPLVVHLYARILFELAELNKVNEAWRLMKHLDLVCRKVAQTMAAAEGAPRPRLNLAAPLTLAATPQGAPQRTYEGKFHRHADGRYRLDFKGSLGKEDFYLPGAFLALLQSCLEQLTDPALNRLCASLARLHAYYRDPERLDFWDSGTLAAAPLFALAEAPAPPPPPEPEAE